tara:strand:- start:355 stop:1545 length:1191 start_codon:yes stop_codon:yes gene_type:complete
MFKPNQSINLFFINISGVLISILGLSLISRIYQPREIGIFSSSLSLISIIAVISSGKLELLLVKNIPLKLAAKSNIAAIILALISSFILFLFYLKFTDIFFALIAAITLLSIFFYDLTVNAKIRQRGSSWTIKAKTKKNFLFVFLSAGLGLISSNFYSLLIAEIFSRFIITISSVKRLYRLSRLRLYKSIFKSKYLFNFAILTGPSWLLSNLFILSIPLLINLIYDPREVSYYALQSRIMFGGEILLAGYINQRLIGEFKAGKSFRKIFKKYLRILFVSSLFFVSASVVFLKFFASKFFGNEYSIFSESSIYYFPLAFSQAITSSLHISLNLINKEKIQALWNFTRGLILCFMTVFFLKFKYPSYIFVLNVGILNLVMSIIFFSIVYFQIYRQKKV